MFVSVGICLGDIYLVEVFSLTFVSAGRCLGDTFVLRCLVVLFCFYDLNFSVAQIYNLIICSLGCILFAPVSDPLKNNKGENVALKHVGHNLNPFPVALVCLNVAAGVILVVQLPRFVLSGVP